MEQHGEVFLNKHTGVGKSLHRARALQKRHDDFQQVAQVKHRYDTWLKVVKCSLFLLSAKVVEVKCFGLFVCFHFFFPCSNNEGAIIHLLIYILCDSEYVHQCREASGGSRPVGAVWRVWGRGDLPGSQRPGAANAGTYERKRMFKRCSIECLILFMCVSGLHSARWTEEAAAGPRRILLHAHKGGSTHLFSISNHSELHFKVRHLLINDKKKFSLTFCVFLLLLFFRLPPSCLLSSLHGWRASRSSSPQTSSCARTRWKLCRL